MCQSIFQRGFWMQSYMVRRLGWLFGMQDLQSGLPFCVISCSPGLMQPGMSGKKNFTGNGTGCFRKKEWEWNIPAQKTGMLHCCLRVSATKATADIICFFSTTALQQESGILPVLYFPPPCSFPFLCLGRWGWDQSLE